MQRLSRSFALLRETRVFEVILPELAEDYGRRSEPWELLADLLGRMDAEHAGDNPDVRTGEILASLLLWPLMQQLGWTGKAPAPPPRGMNLREFVDERLRPIAVR